MTEPIVYDARADVLFTGYLSAGMVVTAHHRDPEECGGVEHRWFIYGTERLRAINEQGQVWSIDSLSPVNMRVVASAIAALRTAAARIEAVEALLEVTPVLMYGIPPKPTDVVLVDDIRNALATEPPTPEPTTTQTQRSPRTRRPD